MVQVPSPAENPYGGQEPGSPASAYQGEMEGVDLETSWNRKEGVEVDGEYSVRSQENHDEMEGGCEDPGECPLDHNPSIPLDPGRHSSDRTSETGEAQGGAD